MFESRCGVCCNSCERKDKVNCTGCITMEKPFWGGDCKVKNCCESSHYNHCGECKSFPCEMLTLMGTEFGYSFEPRIEQCKKWLID